MSMMKKACVIGSPISHSLSPKLHSYWLKQYQIDGSYTARDVPPEHLAEAIEQLKNEGFSGFNITIPHKQAILRYVQEIDEVAQRIGAVNTVVIDGDKLKGSNTDAFGFIENLKINLSNNPDNDIKNVLAHPVILGAGGATRAVVKALVDEGTESIDIIARDPQKAESLHTISDRLHIRQWSSLPKILPQASLLVNTTPIGMQGKSDAFIDLTGLSQSTVVTDIVYNPLLTPLLVDAKSRGNVVVDGLGMLIFQAIPGFEAWFQKRPEIDLDDLQKLKNFLVVS